MTLSARQTIFMDQEDVLCFSGCWKEQNLHASMLREWHSWFWAGLGLCVMTSLCVLGQVCSRSCPCLALTCHRAGAAPASFTTSLPACLLPSPLWLPQALNQALCRQCTCVGYVQAEQWARFISNLHLRTSVWCSSNWNGEGRWVGPTNYVRWWDQPVSACYMLGKIE